MRGRSMPWRRCNSACVCALAWLIAFDLAGASDRRRALQLEVFINGSSTGLIGSFFALADGRIAARPDELEEIGLKAEAIRPDQDGLIALDRIDGLIYRYEEQSQRLFVTVGDEQRLRKMYSALKQDPRPVATEAGYGTVLNYDLLAASRGGPDLRGLNFGGTSLSLDGRAFTPYGSLSQSAILRSGIALQSDVLRLNT